VTTDDPGTGTPSAHLGDALSALLDGELGDAEAVAVRAHLATCSMCETELAEIGEARSWLRDLPPVEPPADFVERVSAGSVPERNAGPPASSQDATVTPIGEAPGRRRQWRAGVAAMSACAAVTIVVLGMAAPRDPPASPPLGRFIVAHEAEVGVGDPVSELATAVVPLGFRR